MKDPSLYVPVHLAIWEHPKTKRLARRLGVHDVQAVGHLVALWTWAVQYAPDGDLSDFDAEEIAAAGRWPDDHETFVDALHASGWLDACHINDWGNYAGAGLAERSAARDRKRRERDRKRGHTSGHADVTSPDRDVSRDVTPERDRNGSGTERNGTDTESGALAPVPVSQTDSASPPIREASGTWVKVRSGRQGGWQAGKPYTVAELLNEPEGEKLRGRFKAFDGKNGRPTLEEAIETLWPNFADWSWPSPAMAKLANYLAKNHETHRRAYEAEHGAPQSSTDRAAAERALAKTRASSARFDGPHPAEVDGPINDIAAVLRRARLAGSGVVDGSGATADPGE